MITCPLCQGKTHSIWARVPSYDIVVCGECGVGFTAPFPDPGALAAVNSTIYEVEQRAALYLRLRGDLERRYRRQLRRIALLKPSGRLLDIGCSIGLFAHQAKLMGFCTEGVELNEACAEYGTRTFGLTIHTRLPEVCSPEESYDVITLFDVLEHVPDPVNFLRTVRALLKPDGLLVVQAPNLDSMMAATLREKWAWLCPPDHLYHFSPVTLPRVLAAAGFAVTGVRSWEPAKDFAGNLLEAYIPAGPLGSLVRKLVRGTRVLEIPVLLLQKRWWAAQRGGLLVVEAVPHQTAGGIFTDGEVRST